MPPASSEPSREDPATAGNLLRGLPAGPLAAERFEALLARGGVRVERIVSTGQSSPPGFWYDQPEAEWVLLLQGSACLLFDDEPAPRALGPGDWVFIEAGRRHRVEHTSTDPPAVWLAVHLPA